MALPVLHLPNFSVEARLQFRIEAAGTRDGGTAFACGYGYGDVLFMLVLLGIVNLQ